MSEVIVKQEEGLEVAAEVLATAITKIADGLEGWRKAGMKRSALVLLLVQSTKICKRDVEAVLDGISRLQNEYCLPKPIAPKKGPQ